jgi:hypothetical protein
MAAALIGLIGLIAGALLGGLLTFSVEMSKRRRTAHAAGSLVASELTAVIDRLLNAASAPGGPKRWKGKLPTRAWETCAADLVAKGIPKQLPGKPEPFDSKVDEFLATCRDAASGPPAGPAGPSQEPSPPADAESRDKRRPGLLAGLRKPPRPDQRPDLLARRKPPGPDQRPDLLARLGAVYASIEIWNSEGEDPGKKELCRDVRFYSTVQGDLKRYTRSLEHRGRTITRRYVTLVAAVAVGFLAVVLLTISRVDVTSVTVASALQSRLDGASIVHCDSYGSGDWQCLDYHLSGPLRACHSRAAAGDASAVEFAARRAVCAEAAPPTPYGVEDDGPQLMVVPETPAAARESQAQREQQYYADAYETPAPAFPLWKQIIWYFKGH